MVLAVGLVSCGPRALKDATQEKGHAPTPVTPKIEFFNSKTESVVLRAWADYEPSLRRGDFLAAQHVLQNLTEVLGGPAQFDEFLNKYLPLQSRRTLVLGSLCKACTDGKCAKCEGTGRCEICKGNGVCTACGGKGALARRCQGSSCSGCNGTGKCSVCRGTKKQTCSVCNGTSKGEIEQVRCPACGGSGSVPRSQFQRNGSYDMITCSGCGGSGYAGKRQHVCGNCGGTGWVYCTTCKGSGRCVECKGGGHDLRCSLCKGTGMVQQECEECNGSKKCGQCKGTGSCGSCDGQKVCAKCQGSNVVTMKLPVDVKWLKQDHGFIVEPAVSLSIPGQQQGQKLDSRLFHKGRIDLLCNQRKVALDVGDGEVICLSPVESFDWVNKALFQ